MAARSIFWAGGSAPGMSRDALSRVMVSVPTMQGGIFCDSGVFFTQKNAQQIAVAAAARMQ
jgi:hypothetical protein